MVTELLAGYRPRSPYIIQSGKNAGKVLELMMFENYGLLYWMFRQGRGRRDDFYLHLAWLLRQGESLQPKMTCPQCQERPVQFFSVRYSRYSGRDFSVGVLYTYCEECRKNVDTQGEPIQILPFHFSSLNQFYSGSGQKEIVGLFRQVYDLPKPLSREQAFEFFNSVEPYTE